MKTKVPTNYLDLSYEERNKIKEQITAEAIGRITEAIPGEYLALIAHEAVADSIRNFNRGNRDAIIYREVDAVLTDLVTQRVVVLLRTQYKQMVDERVDATVKEAVARLKVAP